MSILTRTYTFTDGTTAYGSQVDSEISNIVNTLNNLDNGSTTWTNVKVTTLLPQADVNAGGHKITNVGHATAVGDALGANDPQVINGLMLVDGGVTGAKLATGTVTDSKLSANTITNASIASQTIRGSTANSGGSAQEISQGTISTVDLRANAVTQIQSSTNTASSHGTDITTVTITTTGGKVLLMAFANINVSASSNNAGVSVDITQGNTAITGGRSVANLGGGITGTQQFTLHVCVVDSPVAGTYTYKFSYTIQNGSFVSLSGYSLQAIELKA